MEDFDLLQTVVLALIQGLTEFLPISSSAHLLLPSFLLGWSDQGLAFDVAVHLGSLLAVLLYFRKELYRIVQGLLVYAGKKQVTEEGRQGLYLIIATIPVIIAGFLLKDLVDSSLRSLGVIATTTLLFAVLLWLAEKRSLAASVSAGLNWKSAMIIGLSQVLALIPGTSRSGVTMTAAMFCRLDRQQAARFSFLLSIPTIAGASLLLLLDLLQSDRVNWAELASGMLIAALSAYLCIHLFLKFISRTGFLPFVIYRLLLGLVLLVFMF